MGMMMMMMMMIFKIDGMAGMVIAISSNIRILGKMISKCMDEFKVK